MSEEDSVAQMAWYDKQKREIEKERIQLEMDRLDVEKLNKETARLIEMKRFMKSPFVSIFLRCQD